MTLIKVCGITSLPDALAAVECGADALGFNFYGGSPRCVTPAAARRIIEELPPGVLCVGVFVNEAAPEAVTRAASEAGVHAVQLHGDETPEYCASLGGVEVIKALRVGPAFDVAEVGRYGPRAILLDAFSAGARGGTGTTFDWSLARAAREMAPRLYLAGGLNAGNVAAAIEAVGPYAVDVCSGVESATGRKDRGLLRRFVGAARGAERIP